MTYGSLVMGGWGW